MNQSTALFFARFAHAHFIFRPYKALAWTIRLAGQENYTWFHIQVAKSLHQQQKKSLGTEYTVNHGICKLHFPRLKRSWNFVKSQSFGKVMEFNCAPFNLTNYKL